MFAPRHIPQEERLNTRQRFVVVLMNVLLLAELTISMFLGQQHPENITAIFLKTFLPLCIGTVIGTRILIRRLHVSPLPARSDGDPE